MQNCRYMVIVADTVYEKQAWSFCVAIFKYCIIAVLQSEINNKNE